MTEKEKRNTDRIIGKIEDGALVKDDLSKLTLFELKFSSLISFGCNPKKGNKESIIQWMMQKYNDYPEL